MHPSALLEHAAELLREVMRFDAPADGVVSAYFRRHHVLGARERHALAETVYAALRERLRWQHLARDGTGPLQRRLAILAWQGDAAGIERALTPAEREWRTRAAAVDPATLPLPLQLNLPDWLSAALTEQVGSDALPSVAAALMQQAPLDLRANLVKGSRDALKATLAAAGLDASPTPYSPWGLRVRGRPALGRLEAYRDGAFEIQDEGSQLLCLLPEVRRGETVVDFCAGAGGKTLALGAVMRNTGRLYAFDVSGHRLAALKERVARSGLSNVHTLQIAHERDERVRRLGGKVDRVLVDAPCSGMGTLRRNPDLKWRHTPQTVADLQQQQLRILREAARLLRPGGRLVYATCSLLRAENEDVVDAFEAEVGRDLEPLPAAEALSRGGVEQASGLVDGRFLHLWPHRNGSDGFFAAIWRRR